MDLAGVLLLYCIGVLAAALAGGVAPVLFRFTHLQLQAALSFVSGLILGVALLHLLPQALELARSTSFVVEFILLGLLAMFLLERFFCFHHHEADIEEAGADHDHQHGCGGGGAACGHAHGGADDTAHGHVLRWSGVTVGLVIHSLLNGVALAASAQAARLSGQTGIVAVGTFLAIALHKPFDALTISMLMRQGGNSTRAILLVTSLFSLAVPLGVGLFFLGLAQAPHAGDVSMLESGSQFVCGALALSVGVFLCIALSDLLPELHFHSHDRLALSGALIAGVMLAWSFPDDHGEGHHHGDGMHRPAVSADSENGRPGGHVQPPAGGEIYSHELSR